MSIENVSFKNSRGLTLSGVFHPAKGQERKQWVMLSHGMLSTKDSRKHVSMSLALSELGFNVFRFDFSGQGESEGESSIITYSNGMDDLLCAIDLMEKRGAEKFILIGSSMGSAVSMLTSAQKGDKVATMALMASVTKTGMIWEAMSDEERQQWKDEGYFVFHGNKVAIDLIEDGRTVDLAACLKNFKGPVLFVHGENDELIPFDQLSSFTKLHPGKTDLHKIVGADHRLSEEKHRQEAVNTIKNWLIENL